MSTPVSKKAGWTSWKAMKARCYNPNHIGFRNYGGRGIRVCDRWLNSAHNFFADMGEKPSAGHSLDRIDSDGDYTPENCRWATRLEQNQQRRKRKDNTSGVVGVYFRKDKQLWFSIFEHNKKRRHSPYFKNFDDAVAWRKLMESGVDVPVKVP